MRLTFQLPIPDKILFSNGSNGNEFVRRKAKRAARSYAKTEAERVLKDAGISPPKWTKARYRVTLFHVGPQRRDPDNVMAALKGSVDGLADAGIVKNDRDMMPEFSGFVKVDRMPRIEISIEEEK